MCSSTLLRSIAPARQLCSVLDGWVILTIAANTTRRAAARKSQFTLRQANARLLGAILCKRPSPSPSAFTENFEFVSRKPVMH